ncbi:nascent polypeptide-associated complex subunit alpha, muscle-specific form isoform X2 [Drosophila subpulchrella]|uniref:nascent polypeptide-associated complex subunit alpha, muscle-specific form isoform X2 n=1 Tax=Drosophila subpulchrella TaxID=1486046 RepID=UPI0018A179E4|nr:nascent polypeptide-associated complex subunit alpha, muscle-specific form isoform X2 [Drosophila subpulchrella]
MSERSKGDVSRINNNANPTRVVKNPLLSASVTGLSFDDFPNKPQLLPAAPPVVHATPPAAPVLIAGILNREPKTLVTVGQPSSIDDSEALDEINLNTSSEDSIGAGGSSPYQGAGDQNANPLLEPLQEAGNDSLLSQAASSFTALPSVASNVFSTFSKRIYSGSRESSEEPKLDIQPTYIQQASYVQPVAPVPAPFYAAPPAASNEVVAPEPPKFYAPTEIPAPNVGVPGPPPAAGNPNTYRFTARKKLYAPIPGLSEQSGQGAQIPQAPQAIPSFQTPPYPPQPTPAANPAPFDISAQLAPIPPEERKSGSGLFSLTSLVPTGVLQNISGLVQSATGRSSEPEYTNPPQPTVGYFDVSSGPPAPSTNLFGASNPGVPPGGNYFVPSPAPSLSSTGVVAPTAVGTLFGPPVPVPGAPPAAAPPGIGAFFNPAPTSIVPGVPPSVFTPGAAPPVAIQGVPSIPVNASTVPPASLPPTSAVGGFFTPASGTIATGVSPSVPSVFTSEAVPSVAPPAVPTIPVSTTAAPPANLPPTSAIGGFFNPGEAPLAAKSFATQDVNAPGVPPTGFFPPAAFPPASNPNPLPGAPPVAAAPPPAAGQASYRLQKGTRLYKSPLTAQETAATSGFAAPLPPTSVPPAIFNPFGAPASGPLNSVAQPETQGNQGVSFDTQPVYTPAVPPTGGKPEIGPGFTAPPPAVSAIFAPPPAASIASVVPPPAASFANFAPPTAASVAPPAVASIASVAPPSAASIASAAPAPAASIASVAPPPTEPIASVAPPPAASIASVAPPPTAPIASVAPPPAASIASVAPPPTAPIASVAPPPAASIASVAPPPSASIPNHPSSVGIARVPLFSAPTISSLGIPFFNPQSTNTVATSTALETLIQGPPSVQGNPLFAPTSSANPFFVPQPSKESALFTNSESEKLVQEPSLTQGIPFFAPPPAGTGEINLFTPQPNEEQVSPKEEPKKIQTQEEPLSGPPPEITQSVNLSTATSEAPFFGPPVIEPVVEYTPATNPESSAPLFASSSEPDQGPVTFPAPSAPVEQETPLFVPVPALSGQSQGVPLYPPPPTGSTDTSGPIDPPSAASSDPAPTADPVTSSVSSFFSPAQEDSTSALFALPPAANTTIFTPTPPTTSTLFAAIPTAQSAPELVPATSAELVDAPAAFLGTPEASTTNLFQSNTETQTVFSPFAQTKATPLIQKSGPELIPPPIGFFAQQTEAEALNHPPLAPSPLQSFFDPAPGAAASADFNFFASPAPGSVFPDLPVQQGIAPPPLALEPPTEAGDTSTAPAPLGFELLSQSQQAQDQAPSSNENSYPNSSVNSFTGYFGGPSAPPAPSVAPEPVPTPVGPVVNCDPVNFFDQVPQTQSQIQQANEDQRIQNFFNNPPLQDQPAAPGELKYDIVHSGVAVKQLQERSQTPVSNLVEPPSSACSEFSTLAPAPTQSERQAVEDLLQQHLGELPDDILRELRMANANSDKGQVATPTVAIPYSPVVVHWFYKRSVDTKFIWTPFSHYDSALLETSLNLDDSSLIIPVEGGRYDVNIKERTKTPVYWEGKAIEVRRCSWFYKGVDSKYVPYTEDTAALLESEYKRSAETGEWHQKIMLGNGEQVVFHGPTVIVHFLPQQNADTWGTSTQSSMRPRVVKRDLDDFTIEQGESQRVDHLLFMVHGIGSACDLKMRSVEEVVDDFRVIAQQLVQSHYKNSTDMGLVGRVEVLPISWHGHLHSEEMGIDEKLKSITLESIPRLRNFTNDTLLDVLFYTSPKYCQKIMNTVADELNDVYLNYRMRHPEFNGGVSLAGHSLGSLILFDLLCHQEPLKESEEENKNPDQLPQKQASLKVQLPTSDLLPKQVSYAMGPEGTGQPVITYTQLIFHPKKFFALGSPIGMFVTIRGIDKLGLDFHLPTCPGFYNIFHPFDPVAYRIEALVNPDMSGIRPVLIPHHKGRKRMHLELKETMTRVGADIKQRFMDTFKTTLDSVNFLATVTKVKKEAEESLEKETSQTSSQALQKQNEDHDESSVASSSYKLRNRTDSNSTTASEPEFIELDFPLGKLNDSKRVDYVLQEAPLEFINEYIFALSSHVCYWGSEDTILFVMKEIYASLGISTDSQVPQSSMTIERPVSHESSVSHSLLPM